MAHKLKYYKDIQTQGQYWRVEIHQETEEDIKPQEIGPVIQGLRLIVQGDQADIDTPIVKTSLEMVFVDAYDLNDDRKCGYWEEFYTSSATEYQVKLKKNNILEWTGYITPDSFSESLQYHGSVTIIARDNLGSLQDFEYSGTSNANGMKSISDVLRKGLEVVSFPMELSIDGLGARRFAHTLDSALTSDIWETLFNNRSLVGKTWQDAIESLLYSVGLVLRYVGKNTFVLASIRDLPLYGFEYYWDVPERDVVFCAYGNRELSPAAKTVVDEVRFEIQDNLAYIEMPADVYGEEGLYNYRQQPFPPIVWDDPTMPNEPLIVYEMPVFNVENGSWSTPSLETSLFLNPFKYKLKEGLSSQSDGNLRADDVVYLAANNNDDDEDIENYGTSRLAKWTTEIGPGLYRLSFTAGTPVGLYDNNTKLGFYDVKSYLTRLSYYLKWKSSDGSTQLVYDAKSDIWKEGVSDKLNIFYGSSTTFPKIFEFGDLQTTTRGFIELEIVDIIVSRGPDATVGVVRGAYVQIKDVTLKDVGLEKTFIPESLKVTTQYNKKNNIRVQRNAKYGFNMGNIASPITILNGLYVYTNKWYYASDRWVFNSTDEPNPLSVLLHQQLLAYYSKPNNVLTGELATIDPLFNAIYKWKGKKHLLTSGALNVLTGRIENVVLREFMRYDHMWEMWAEQEEYNLKYSNTSFSIIVHSNVRPSADDVEVPDWVTGVRVLPAEDGVEGVYKIGVSLMVNLTSSERTGIIKVGSLVVKVTQASNN